MLCDALWAVGAQGGIRTRNALEKILECRTGDSRAYSRPAPASRGPGYTTSARPIQRTGREPGIFCPGQPRYAKATKLKPSSSYSGKILSLTTDSQGRSRQRLNPDQLWTV